MKDKQKYSIGAACRIVDLPQSVLRYWESVFDQLNPEKTPGGTRKYSEQDIAMILKIKQLLYKRKFTIAGAKTLIMSLWKVPDIHTLLLILEYYHQIIQEKLEHKLYGRPNSS